MEASVDLYFKPWTVFWVIQSLGLLLLILGLVMKFSFYFKGKGKLLVKEPDYTTMIKTFFREVLFQKHIAQRSRLRWSIHFLIFSGFMGLITLSAIAVALETVIPEGSGISRYMLDGQGYNYYKAAGDFFGLILLLGLSAAFLRRFVFRARQLQTELCDTATLVFLLLLVATGFLLEGVRIALSTPLPQFQYSFVGYQLASLFRGLEGLPQAASFIWTFHALLTAALLAYFPHSKFLHVINSPVEIILNSSEERMRGDLYI